MCKHFLFVLDDVSIHTAIHSPIILSYILNIYAHTQTHTHTKSTLLVFSSITILLLVASCEHTEFFIFTFLLIHTSLWDMNTFFVQITCAGYQLYVFYDMESIVMYAGF